MQYRGATSKQHVITLAIVGAIVVLLSLATPADAGSNNGVSPAVSPPMSPSPSSGPIKVQDDNLVVTGTRDPDRLRIVTSSGTTWLVELNDRQVLVDQVEGDILIDLKGGDDSVSIARTVIQEDLKIDTGRGNDEVVLIRTSIPGDLRINAGRGDDVVTYSGPSVQGEVRVSTGRGHDEVSFGTLFASGGDLRISTGSGNDHVSFRMAAYDAINVLAGSGDDTIDFQYGKVERATSVTTGSGNDELSILGTELAGPTVVDMGSNNDLVHIEAAVFQSETKLIGGAGRNDVLELDGRGFGLGDLHIKRFEHVVDGRVDTPG